MTPKLAVIAPVYFSGRHSMEGHVKFCVVYLVDPSFWDQIPSLPLYPCFYFPELKTKLNLVFKEVQTVSIHHASSNTAVDRSIKFPGTQGPNKTDRHSFVVL